MDVNTTTEEAEKKSAKQKVQKYYLDLQLLGGTTGPTKDTSSKLQKITKAITAIKVNNDLTITIGDTSKATSTKKDDLKVCLEGAGDPSDQIIKKVASFFKAWDQLYPDAGTPQYMEKQLAFETARRNTLASMGIDPDSPKIVFTEAQKAQYYQIMKDFTFTYTRIQLTWKQPGKKKVRSKSYSYIKSDVDLNKHYARLSAKAKEIEPLVKVTRVQ